MTTFYQKLSKLEIAKTQLDRAVQLYIDGEDLISAITLAGAADEILGKLAIASDEKSALDKKVEDLCELHEFVFGAAADPKNFVEICNKTRNELKHRVTGEEIKVDLEQEAVNMLRRAIENYVALVPGSRQKFWAFNKEHVRRWRERNHGYA